MNGDVINLNYTSGTTGNPKGVVYHRGAFFSQSTKYFGMRHEPHWFIYASPNPPFLTVRLVVFCAGRVHLAASMVPIFALRRAWCRFGSLNIIDSSTKSVGLAVRNLSSSVYHQCPAGSKISGFSHHVEAVVAGAVPPVAIIEGCMRHIGINVNPVHGLTGNPMAHRHYVPRKRI